MTAEMGPAEKYANQRVYEAAKCIERASQYGIPAQRAHQAYRAARVELWQARVEDWTRAEADA